MQKKFMKRVGILLCCALLLALLPTAGWAEVVRDGQGNISYKPTEQGKFSKGGYTIDKISHPTRGAGEVDAILEADDNRYRGNSYSWSMADGGEDSEFIYIGTCYNSTYYIFHNNVKTSLENMKTAGTLPTNVNTDKVADDIVTVMFGVDKFDKTNVMDWDPVIISVSKKTGESKIVFRERDHWGNKKMFPIGWNGLSGYRMVVEFNGKLYFAGMGNPTATLVEVDPLTNTARIAYYDIRFTPGVSNGVHGLLVYDNEILMCLATDNYDGNKTPGGIIVASSDAKNWRIVADQDDFDGLPAVMQIDGLNGGGIWDIIEYNGYLYVTVVTDKNIDGKINKQGFAMYRGEKKNGKFTWKQIIGDQGEYPFGLGINYSMSCNMWVYNGYLYLGTYNDPMLDLAEIPATGNFELLYNDLDHSIYLYRMNEKEEFVQVGGKNDNPNFPKGPIGNLGAGLGNNSNQYVWRMGVHNDEFYIGTYDTSTLTYNFTQITDGTVANMEYEDIRGRADVLQSLVDDVLGEYDSPILNWFKQMVFSDYTLELYQKLAGFATEMSADKNPVPDYRKMLADYEAFKESVYDRMDKVLKMSPAQLLREYAKSARTSTYSLKEFKGFKDELQKNLKTMVDEIFKVFDAVVYDETIHNFVYYFGCNYYAQQCERGFDLLVSKDGVNFDAITRDGFGDEANHGLRCITSTANGVYLGTANPYYGTQLWLMHSSRDKAVEFKVTFNSNGGEGAMEDQIFAAKQTKALSANAFTKADHAFCGWNTAPDGSGDAYTDKQQITVTSDMTLYAQWTANQYTVTFKSNGGEGTMEAQVFIAGQPQALAANAFTRKNHVFCGWNTAADGSGQTLENKQLLTVTSDMTLYAQWESANISALPQTGDNSRIAVWIALLAAACAALAIILRRNKKA